MKYILHEGDHKMSATVIYISKLQVALPLHAEAIIIADSGMFSLFSGIHGTRLCPLQTGRSEQKVLVHMHESSGFPLSYH